MRVAVTVVGLGLDEEKVGVDLDIIMDVRCEGEVPSDVELTDAPEVVVEVEAGGFKADKDTVAGGTCGGCGERLKWEGNVLEETWLCKKECARGGDSDIVGDAPLPDDPVADVLRMAGADTLSCE